MLIFSLFSIWSIRTNHKNPVIKFSMTQFWLNIDDKSMKQHFFFTFIILCVPQASFFPEENLTPQFPLVLFLPLNPFHLLGRGKGRRKYRIGLLWSFREIKCKGTWTSLGTQQTWALRHFFSLPRGFSCFARFYPGSTLFVSHVLLSVIYSYGFSCLLDVREDCISSLPLTADVLSDSSAAY